ncbi:Uncharacterised protein [Mycobacteroides abscessus subsp. abscessus]|nr:Uncharacterised protein [Mycobacteroides abscessus subsp. abscessus]
MARVTALATSSGLIGVQGSFSVNSQIRWMRR